jgi:hypothetical protein
VFTQATTSEAKRTMDFGAAGLTFSISASSKALISVLFSAGPSSAMHIR